MYSTTVERPGIIFDTIKQASIHIGSIKVIALTWIFGLFIAVPPLLGWSYYAVEPNGIR